MLKKGISYILFTMVVMVGMVSYRSSTAYYEGCTINNVAFQGGEKLVYKAYYKWGFVWIPAGEATFEVKEDNQFIEINVNGKSYPAYDGFFRLRDRFYTKISKTTMLPAIFEREVNEGDYQKFERIVFDQDDYTAAVYQGTDRASAVRSIHTFNDCMHDLLSLLYFMRNIDVEKYKMGDYIETNIFFDKEVFPIKVRYQGVEANKNIKELGRYNTVKVVPDLIEGTVFNKGDQLEAWVTNDKNKIPLLIETPLKIGSLKAVLKNYSGLRSPMKAKVK